MPWLWLTLWRMRSNNEYARQRAIGQLISMGPQAVDSVIVQLRDGRAYVRRAAADVLRGIGDPSVEPLVGAFVESLRVNPTPGFSSREEQFRLAAEEIIADHKPVSTTALIAALKTEFPAVLKRIAQVLGQADEGRQYLLSKLSDGNAAVSLRLACYSTLEQLGPPNSPTAVITQDLIEAAATEIRILFSRTRSNWIIDEVYTTGAVLASHYEETPDPDIAGIRALLSLLSTSLRERVRELSGEAKSLFDG